MCRFFPRRCVISIVWLPLVWLVPLIPEGHSDTAVADESAPTARVENARRVDHNVTTVDEPRYYEQVEPGQSKLIECDVAVYGGTPAGVTAAIQAAREGKKTVLLSFNRHVGGMTSGGLTATDLGRQSSIGRLALEFYNRIGKARDYRPADAEALFREIAGDAPRKPGEGDFKVQSYNFRMQLFRDADRIAFPKPREYDAGRYALLARFLNLDKRIEWRLNYTTDPLTDGRIQMRIMRR